MLAEQLWRRSVAAWYALQVEKTRASAGEGAEKATQAAGRAERLLILEARGAVLGAAATSARIRSAALAGMTKGRPLAEWALRRGGGAGAASRPAPSLACAQGRRGGCARRPRPPPRPCSRARHPPRGTARPSHPTSAPQRAVPEQGAHAAAARGCGRMWEERPGDGWRQGVGGRRCEPPAAARGARGVAPRVWE
eukprot:scaffold932_cov299-Prasinococcus_capsulatus_cf.AAC.3